MPQEGQKTITVSGKRLTELEKKYEQEKIKHTALSFASFVAEAALIELERRQMIKEEPLLSLVGITDNMVILKDFRNEEKLVEVQIKEKKIRCLSCGNKGHECIHIGFAIALPEIRKALRE